MMLSNTSRAPCGPCRRPAAGFTLVELLITVAVVSFLLALAVPAFRSFMQSDQQWVQQNTLVMGLNAARSEAIKQDVAGGVQVCSSTDGATCTNTPWGQGWIVLSSANATPLQVIGALPTGTTLSEANNNFSVTFLSNGAVNTAVAFKMCDARGGAQARYSQVTAMGRVVSSPTVGQDLSSPPQPLVCP
jgi:type IV fimbrial biogenesis protein FimT